jgi:NAD(P)-dependent dehydrogenase (short-subunit alcohol dehydrogenase family)
MHASRGRAQTEALMVTLITGVGAKGQVGEAVAATLARRGDQLLLVSRSSDEVKERVADLSAAGFAAAGYACDLADAAAVAALATQIHEAHGGRLDNVVHLAGGFALTGPIHDSDPLQVDRMMRINYFTAFNVARAFIRAVRDASGSFVFFASENVLEGARTKGSAGYTAAKSAVVALMRSLADEGREFGVRANALAPASIRTATNESVMGSDARYVEREEVADAVAFLCSAEAGAITGQVIRLR